ncbi:hypothetical protein M758_UG174400 [Ceratodon purpureus]|nr:hypothetical protein M758_UG174400 [Ceratodon purpureus]
MVEGQVCGGKGVFFGLKNAVLKLRLASWTSTFSASRIINYFCNKFITHFYSFARLLEAEYVLSQSGCTAMCL